MTIVSKPGVARRTWLYVYRRPEGPHSWPALIRHGREDLGREDKPIHADEFRITITQDEGDVPLIQSIYVSGSWPNGNPVTNVRVHHEAGRPEHLIVTAPDWVMLLATDAQMRSMQEVGNLGQTPLSPYEGMVLDRIARGEAIPHYSTCARCNHGHIPHRQKTKIRPCSLCDCKDLIRRSRDANSSDRVQPASLAVGV